MNLLKISYFFFRNIVSIAKELFHHFLIICSFHYLVSENFIKCNSTYFILSFDLKFITINSFTNAFVFMSFISNFNFISIKRRDSTHIIVLIPAKIFANYIMEA